MGTSSPSQEAHGSLHTRLPLCRSPALVELVLLSLMLLLRFRSEAFIFPTLNVIDVVLVVPILSESGLSLS